MHPKHLLTKYYANRIFPLQRPSFIRKIRLISHLLRMYVVSHISKKKSTLNEEGTSKIGVYPNLLMEQGDISYTLLNGTNIYQ